MSRKKLPTSRLREIDPDLCDRVREALAENPELFKELDTALLDADTDQAVQCYSHTRQSSSEAHAYCLSLLWPMLTEEREISSKELREVAQKMEKWSDYSVVGLSPGDTCDTATRDMLLSDLRRRMNAARRFQRFAIKSMMDADFADISATVNSLTGDTSFLLAKSGGWVAFCTHSKPDAPLDLVRLVETTCGPGVMGFSNHRHIPFTIVPLHKLDTPRLSELSKTLPF